MAKKNKRSRPENNHSEPENKRLKPEEGPSTVKRRLQLLEDPPTKKSKKIPSNNISFQVKNQRQFTSKIRCLKDKYVRKRKKGADEKSFANAHVHNCFKLSKVIWESTKVEESLKPANEEKVGDWFVNSSLVGAIARFGIGEDVMKQRWSMVSMKTKKKLENKFKLLQDEASEYLSLRRSFFA